MLDIWVVYEFPKDHAGKFVARRWRLDQPTADILIAATLEELRALLPAGLHRMPRYPADDPVIVETWI